MGLVGNSKAFPKGVERRTSTQGKILYKKSFQDFQTLEDHKTSEGRYTKNFFKLCEKYLREDGYVFIPAPKQLSNIRRMNKFTQRVTHQYSYFDSDKGRIVYLGNILSDDPNHSGFVFMRENNYHNFQANSLLPESE